jgi:hypothetical protein
MRLDEGQQSDWIDDVEEREETQGGVEEDAVEGRSKAGPGQQSESQERQRGELEVAVGAGEGEVKEDRDGGKEPPEGNVDRLLVGQTAVLVCGQRGDDGGEERNRPKRREEDQRDD